MEEGMIDMRKLAPIVVAVFVLSFIAAALDRQPTADYHSRREALAKKVGGIVVLVAPLERMDAVYGFRQAGCGLPG